MAALAPHVGSCFQFKRFNHKCHEAPILAGHSTDRSEAELRSGEKAAVRHSFMWGVPHRVTFESLAACCVVVFVCLGVLQTELRAALSRHVLQRTKAQYASELPQKRQYVVLCTLTASQVRHPLSTGAHAPLRPASCCVVLWWCFPFAKHHVVVVVWLAVMTPG